jgi:hypothetical protein
MIDTLDAEDFGPLGKRPLHLIDVNAPGCGAHVAETAKATQAIIVGIDRDAMLPALDISSFDVLLTTAPLPPRPWVHVASDRLDERLATMIRNVAAAPMAASVAIRVLRVTEALSFVDALHVESLAYSTLQGGAAFRSWHAARQNATSRPARGSFVEVDRDDTGLTIMLARPDTRNAMCAGMRDALFNALAAALDDPTTPTVELGGQGACFSTGGDFAEFGSAQDLAAAHAIRVARSGALLLHRLGDRATVWLHGACVGSGIEIPAAAATRIGKPGVFFQLPELIMGLMPGAGGTATLPRAIGRHRTAYMLLSSRRINADTALAWGLLDGLKSG